MGKFGSFYRDYQQTLFNYLMRMTGDYHISSDIMQESFTRYLERYDEHTPNASLLFTIARNALFDQARNRKRNVLLSEDPIDGAASQEYGLMVKQEYRQVITALQQLNDNERDILALAISDGISYRDIASIAGISVENVKVRVHRARLKLKQILQKENES
jgi:RNA polymerase sigma-70 factor (ECF subfamily)